MRLRMNLAALAVGAFFLTPAFSANQLDIRFAPQMLDDQTGILYVNIDVRVENDQSIVLAGQNFRIFYDTETLKLKSDHSVSRLPRDKYFDISFHEKFENIKANEVGDIEFDNNLGFANFSVELKDDIKGGILLKREHGWTTIASLQFEIIKYASTYSAIWGREGMSERYATAFVEFAEWIGPKQISILDIDEFIDMNFEYANDDLNKSDFVYSISPNPAKGYFTIQLNNELEYQSKVILIDMNGRIVKKFDVASGRKNIRIELDNLAPANYLIELHTGNQSYYFREKLFVAR